MYRISGSKSGVNAESKYAEVHGIHGYSADKGTICLQVTHPSYSMNLSIGLPPKKLGFPSILP